MPGPYSAGSIFLQIIPSFREVPAAIAREGQEIERELSKRLSKGASDGVAKGIKDGVEKGAKDSKGAAEKSGKDAGDAYAGKFRKALGDGVASMQRELGALKVDVDDREARRKFDSLKKAVGNLQSDIKLGVDSAYVMAQFQKVLHRIEEIHDKAENIEFRSNIGGVINDARKIHALITELNRLDIEPELKIDRQMGAFERAFKQGIRRMLDDLPPVDLEVDTSAAAAEVAKLRTALHALSDVDLSVEANVGRALVDLARVEGQARAIADNTYNIRIEADALSVEETARKLRDSLNESARINIRPALEEGRFQSEMRAAIQKAQAVIGDVEVNLDIDVDNAQLQEIRADLAALSDKRIGIDIGAATALEQLRVLEQRLHDLARNQDVSLDVRVNATAAAAELENVRHEAERLDGQDATVDVDVRGAHAGANALRDVARETHRAGLNANSSATAFRAFNWRVLAIAAIGPAVIPVLGALAGGILALGPLALAAGAGIGVLALGLWGIGDAFKAMGDAQTKAGQDSRAYEQAVRTAASGVRDAERGLEDARTSAARSARNSADAVEQALAGVANAEQGLADAREQAARRNEQALAAVASAEEGLADAREQTARRNEQAARAVEQASRGVRQAERSVADAQRDAQQAQEDLAQARRDAAEEYEDLQLSLRGGALAERQAIFDVEDALEDLNEVRKTGDADAIARAQLKYERELLSLAEVRERNGDLAEDQAEWARTGVEGSDRVAAARGRVAAADQGVIDAQQALRDAQQAVADAQSEQSRAAIEGSRQIRDAEKAVADARADQSRAAVEGNRQIREAEEALIGAQRDVSNARREQAEAAVDSQNRIQDAQDALLDAQLRLTEAIDETSSSQQKLLDAMGKLGPAGRDFVRYLDGLRPFFQELRNIAQEGFLPGFQSWIDSMVGFHGPLLKRTIESISGALGDMFEGFGRSFEGPAFTRLFNFINTDGPRFIGYIRDILINVGEAMADLIVASGPLADIFGQYLVDVTRDWANAMSDLSRTTGWQEFIEYFRRIIPEVEEFIVAFTGAIINLAISLSPYAEGLLNVLTGILNWIADLDPAVLGPIATGLFIIVSAMQAVFGITQLIVAVRMAAFLTGITAALTGGAGAAGAAGATGALGGFVSQLGLTLGAVGLVAGGLVLLITNSDSFRDAMGKLFGALGDVLESIWGVVEAIGPPMLDALAAVAGFIGDTVAPVLEGLANLITDNADLVGGLTVLFLGWKVLPAIIGAVAGAVRGLATALGILTAAGGAGAGAAGGAAAGGLLGRLAPLLRGGAIGGTALLGFGAFNAITGAPGEDPEDNYDRPFMEQNFIDDFFGNATFTNQDVTDTAAILSQGGQAAHDLMAQYAEDSDQSAMEQVGDNWDFWNETGSDRAAQFRAAQEAAGEYYYSLDKVAQAQASANYWQNELNYRMKEYGAGARETQVAQERFAYWTDQISIRQGGQANSTTEATNAILAQNDVLRSQYDAQFAYEQAVRGVEEAHRALTEAYAMGTGTAEERALRDRAIADAQVQIESATRAAAEAAEESARARLQHLPEQERDLLAQAAFVGELDRQKQVYGELPPALQALRDSMAANIEPVDLLRGKFYALGIEITGVPDSKTITISSDTTEDRLQELRDMGFAIVTLPDGSYAVTAQTAEAEAALADLTRDRYINIDAYVHDVMQNAEAGGYNPGAGGEFGGPVAFADGGAIFGPGTGTSDSILARVSNGEYVIRAAAVKHYGLDLLNAINWQQYREGGPVRKQGFPAFAEGGYVANFGASINLGDLGGLSSIFFRGIAQSVQIVATGAAMMSSMFKQLTADMSNYAEAGSTSQLQIWGVMFATLAGQALGASLAVRQSFDTLLGLTPLVAGIASQLVFIWVTMTSTLERETAEQVKFVISQFDLLRDVLTLSMAVMSAQLLGTWMVTSLQIRQDITSMVDFAIGEFNRMTTYVLGATLAMRAGLEVAWAQVPGVIQKPVNFIIGEVMNKALFGAFNSIIFNMGLPAQWILKPAPPAPSYLAAGGRVPGWSPHDKADNIPAMLTAGEFVLPVDAVRYYGADMLEMLRTKRLRPDEIGHYATGGQIFDLTRQFFPRASLNSSYRPGDPGYHGRNMAADMGESGFAGGLGRAYIAAMKRFWVDNYGRTAEEIIYSGLFNDRPNVKNGGSHNYGAAIDAQHANHLHVAESGILTTPTGGPVGSFLGLEPMFPAWYTEYGSPEGVHKKLLESTLGALTMLQLFGHSPANTILANMPSRSVDRMWSKMGPEVERMFSQAMADGLAGALAPGATATGPVVDIVRSVAAKYGWSDGNEWNSLVRLIQKESGFNPTAQNPTSTAYGLFQFLDSTWASVGGFKTKDPGLQTEFGLRYIGQRYVTPSRALAFHNANNWYGEGGEVGEIIPELNDAGSVLNPGIHVLANKTRQPEVVLPITPGQLENVVRASEQGGYGSPLVGEINLPLMPAATPEAVASEVVHRIDVAARGGRYGG